MNLPDYTTVLEESKEVIRECYTAYDLDEVCLSFNGGKDCTVLLDITIEVLRDLYKSNSIEQGLKVVYIRTSSPFSEIETFVEEIEQHYGVKLKVLGGEMKSTLQSLLDEDRRLKAFLMGTRKTDPYSADLKFMQMTDPSWPRIIRVSPLLNWTYHQIWSYILQKRVPYCNLYDRGYTSIGSRFNTWPNPALAEKDSCTYLPAWHLHDGTLERAGRSNQPIKVNTCDISDNCPRCFNGTDLL